MTNVANFSQDLTAKRGVVAEFKVGILAVFFVKGVNFRFGLYIGGGVGCQNAKPNAKNSFGIGRQKWQSGRKDGRGATGGRW